MFKKLVFVLLVAGFAMLAAGIVLAAEDKNINQCGWTNQKFAEFLGKKLNVTVPATATTDDEKYAALANALSQKGINLFLTAKATDKVKCCDAADALCTISGTKAEGSCDVKINTLIQKGILKLPTTDSDPCGVLCNIEDSFVVIEKFSRPPFSPPDNPPGPHDPPDSSRRD